jgi:ATP-dependent Clp protease ATP-binding subunit ClpA
MKKTFLSIALLSGILFCSNAQISTSSLQNATKKATAVATAAGYDVSSLKTSIMSKLTSSLTLTQAQQPKVSEAVTSFLTDKSKIVNLLKTDKTAYTEKMTALTGNLSSKLKTALTAAQYAKYLGLKPSTSTATNVLSQLFY